MNKKRATIVVFALLIAIMLVTSFYITPLSISDTDPSTYVIVPTLMLPLLALFIGKNNIDPKPSNRSIILGIIIFLIALIAAINFRVFFSYLFLSYRVDMLFFPVFITSLVMILFGAQNLGKFKAIIIYSLIASPTILLPIISFNQAFPVANSLVIYHITKLFFNVTYNPPISIILNGQAIGIGNSCVSIGAIIGLLLFLVPLAYFYNGKDTDKVKWVVSGVLLMMFLNLLRMLGITLAWFNYGPNATTLTIHVFAGILIFYISLIAMVLLATKFSLMLPFNKEKQKNEQLNGRSVAIASILAILYFFLTLNYANAFFISPLQLTMNNTFVFDSNYTPQFASDMIHVANYSSIMFINSNNTLAVVGIFNNTTISRRAPISLILVPRRYNLFVNITHNATIYGKGVFFNSSKVETVYYLKSADGYFVVSQSVVPYKLNNQLSSSVYEYVLMPEQYVKPTKCNYDIVYSFIADLTQLNTHNTSTEYMLENGYCYSRKLVS